MEWRRNWTSGAEDARLKKHALRPERRKERAEASERGREEKEEEKGVEGGRGEAEARMEGGDCCMSCQAAGGAEAMDWRMSRAAEYACGGCC